MLKRIAAITGIFIFSWIAWAILTAVIWVRTDEKSSDMSDAVGELWGTEHTQVAPEISARWTTWKRQELRSTDGGWEVIESGDGEDAPADRKGESHDPRGLLGPVTTREVSSEVISEPDRKEKAPTRHEKHKGRGKVSVEEEAKRYFRVTEYEHTCQMMLDGTDARAILDVDHRKKGLLWFSTYGVDFSSAYAVTNPRDHPLHVTMRFPFPSSDAIYDNMDVHVQKDSGAHVVAEEGDMAARFEIPGKTTRKVTFGYQSRGMDRWSYSFGHDVRMVKNFRLAMVTDFDRIDFPRGSISPDTRKRTKQGGWNLVWDKESVVSGKNIGMLMPHRINPGPLAQKMSFHAPVSLFFFFFVMFILQVLRDIRMHPMNYFFIAASFFAFNLLFSYLVDHMDVFIAFGISATVSIFLVLSYLRMVVGPRFALVEAGISQLIYQVLFGLAHFLEGYTGLTITVGAIVTLAIVMHLTARTDWESVLRIRKRPPSATDAEPITPSA